MKLLDLMTKMFTEESDGAIQMNFAHVSDILKSMYADVGEKDFESAAQCAILLKLKVDTLISQIQHAHLQTKKPI